MSLGARRGAWPRAFLPAWLALAAMVASAGTMRAQGAPPDDPAAVAARVSTIVGSTLDTSALAAVRASAIVGSTTVTSTPSPEKPREGPHASANLAPLLPAPPVAPPPNLDDLDAWLVYKAQSQRAELPREARLFFRRGLDAWHADRRTEAIRLIQGAAELDPGFAAARFTLARWILFHDPAGAAAHCSELIDQVRNSFTLQLQFTANSIYLGVHALYFALLALIVLVVVAHLRELRHPIEERLSRWIRPGTAALWSTLVVAVPFLVGAPVALPATFLCGWLWPHLSLRERSVFITLVVALVLTPWLAAEMSRFALPLHDDRAPLYGALTVRNDPDPAEREAHFLEMARLHPESPFVQFGLAWTANNAGHAETAEAAYRQALRLWPASDVVMNNLGNVLAMQGRTEAAVSLYRRAIAARPDGAAAHFNLSQAHTRRFELRQAAEEMARASSLDFELVRTYKGRTRADGLLPLVDQWPTPEPFWTALNAERPARGERPSLPLVWRNHPLAAGWRIALPALGLAVAGVFLGLRQQRRMPLRHCANCDRVLCRRCLSPRITSLCRGCARAEAGAASSEFSRVLLDQHRRRIQRLPRLGLTAIAALVPGFGLVACRSVFTAFWTLLGVGLLTANMQPSGLPYSYEPRFRMPDQDLSLVFSLLPWIALYAASLLGYIRQRGRDEARRAAAHRIARARPPKSPKPEEQPPAEAA